MVRGFNCQIYLESSDYSNTACRGVSPLDPGRGARCLARWSRRGASPDEDPGIDQRGKIPSTPPGCRTKEIRLSGRHPAGVVFIMKIYRFPGSSALRASTPGLKDDDPSGATPLRDRRSGSVGSMAPRQGCTLHRHRSPLRG